LSQGTEENHKQQSGQSAAQPRLTRSICQTEVKRTFPQTDRLTTIVLLLDTIM